MATWKLAAVFTFAALAAAAPSKVPVSKIQPIVQPISNLFQANERVTPQILDTLLQPNEVNLARNSYLTRDGTSLRLLGDHWTASGANVYWLGLDENVIPPAGSPFYAPFNASYPTHGRITEVMNTLATMGARLIRSQTLGVSVGNPLSMMPALGVFNEAAFDTMDWSIYQARQHGLRIIAPLVDNYVRGESSPGDALWERYSYVYRIITTEVNSVFSASQAIISQAAKVPCLLRLCSFTQMPPSSTYSRVMSNTC